MMGLKGRIGHTPKERKREMSLCTRVKYALTNISSLYTDACVSTFTRHIQYTHKKRSFLRSNDHAHMFISLLFLKPFYRGGNKKKMNIRVFSAKYFFLRFRRVPEREKEKENKYV